MLDDAFHRLEHPCESSLKIVGENEDFVRSFLGESPAQSDGAIQRGLAALLIAAVKNRIPWQAAVIVKGKGKRRISRW